MRIGLISDTHGLLREEALSALVGADLILHAGDIGGAAILDALAGIAPVHAVRGNNDLGPWAEALAEQLDLDAEALRVRVLHDVADFEAGASAPDVLVVGHSHKPRVTLRSRLLEVNPGSAGPRRFSLPISVGWLFIDGKKAHAEIIELELEKPGERRLKKTRL